MQASDMAVREGSLAATHPSQANPEEKNRRLVAKLILLVYALLIFEGVLRKWLFPQWGQLLFFIRDPLVGSAYLIAFMSRVKLGRSVQLFAVFVLAAACLTIVVIQIASASPVPAYLAIYGWRNYFFYIPLVFVAQVYMRRTDLERLARLTLLTAIPMAVLVAVQTSSPAFSVINSGSGEDAYGTELSVLEGGIVRPSGTFTSNVGLAAFVASDVALCIAMWLIPTSTKVISRTWLVCSTLATVVCLALSGSRTAMMWSSTVLVITIVGLLLASLTIGIKTLTFSTALVAFGVVTMPLVFPTQTHAFVMRWVDAGQSETAAYGKGGIFARALHEFGGFTTLVQGAPLFGYGLGSAGNAAWRLGARAQLIPFATDDEIGAAETDWGRNVLELGPTTAGLYIALRLVLLVTFCRKALIAVRRSGNPLAWVLFAYIAVFLTYGQITANGTLNGYIWLFSGFCLAAASVDSSRKIVRRRFALPT